MAQLRHLRQQFANELVIISIHSGKFPAEKSTANIREAVMRHGIEHPVVNDADFAVWQQYAVRAWPTLFLIDPAGKIVHTQSGEILAEEFIPLIKTLINEFEANGQLTRTPLELQPEYTGQPLRPLNYPSKLLLGPEGMLYIADTGHHRILEVRLAGDNLSGEIVRLFGTGQPGLKDGRADEALFHDPHGMALFENTLYIADTENHTIRAINLADGRVRTVAGTGQKAHGHLQGAGPLKVSLRSPWALWVEQGVLLIAMAGSHQIWALVNEERLGIFAGNGREALVDGPLVEASFNQPSDLDVGFGHLFVADSEASAIRAISMGESARVMTLVGQGLFEFGDVDGASETARLQHPTGLTFHQGLIYLADSYNHKIKTLDPTTGQVTTLIGTGQAGNTDGPFNQASLFEPEGVIAANGQLLIADTNNHLIRVANLEDKTLYTLALHGLEKLEQPSLSLSQRLEKRLPPLAVAPGEIELTVKIALPEGFKLNEEARQSLRYIYNGHQIEQLFQASETPHLRLVVEAGQEVNLDLTLYYCETRDQRLCMIHRGRVIVPLAVDAGGKPNAVVVYDVPV